jgi:hypothetical protein
MKESLLRSNTRNVFVDDRDGEEIRELIPFGASCEQIEARRTLLQKTSGFEEALP